MKSVTVLAALLLLAPACDDVDDQAETDETEFRGCVFEPQIEFSPVGCVKHTILCLNGLAHPGCDESPLECYEGFESCATSGQACVELAVKLALEP
jgi:hypothetical protein